MMRQRLVFDLKDYEDGMERDVRHAARAITFRGGYLLMIRNRAGEYKLPGGGVEGREGDIDALCREVEEETGYTVNRRTCRFACEVVEIRRDRFDRARVFEQHSRYYFCSLSAVCGRMNLSDSERAAGFEPVWVQPSEAIRANEAHAAKGSRPWFCRDTRLVGRMLSESVWVNDVSVGV